MDCVFAVQGSDYILLAGDRAAVSNSIIKLQDTYHKISKLAGKQMMACEQKYSICLLQTTIISCQMNINIQVTTMHFFAKKN